MLKRIIKAIASDGSDKYIPTSSEGLEENFAEIEKLIETSGSQHSITGDCHCFTIGPTPMIRVLNGAGFIAILFFLLGGIVGVINAEGTERFLGLAVSWGIAAYLFYVTAWRSPLGVEIGVTIDTDSRLVKVYHTNILRSSFTKAELIPFSSISSVWAEPCMADIDEGTYPWKKVFVEHDNGTTQILALPDGFSPYIDAENFITCFTRIVKSKNSRVPHQVEA